MVINRSANMKHCIKIANWNVGQDLADENLCNNHFQTPTTNMPVVLSIIFFCLLACKRLFEDGSWQTTPEEKNSNIDGPDVERQTSTIRTSEEHVMNQRDYTYTDSWSKLVEINKRCMDVCLRKIIQEIL